jgi:membrane protease YdiL (CAAX protease family)
MVCNGPAAFLLFFDFPPDAFTAEAFFLIPPAFFLLAFTAGSFCFASCVVFAVSFLPICFAAGRFATAGCASNEDLHADGLRKTEAGRFKPFAFEEFSAPLAVNPGLSGSSFW